MPAAAERLNMFWLSQSKACSPTIHLCRYLVDSCENLPKQSYCLSADAKEYVFTFVDAHKCKQVCFCGKLFMCILPQLSSVHLSSLNTPAGCGALHGDEEYSISMIAEQSSSSRKHLAKKEQPLHLLTVLRFPEEWNWCWRCIKVTKHDHYGMHLY